jgi:hypothetical protein
MGEERREVEPELHTIEAREPVRVELASAIDAFLEAGGNVTEVPRNFRADPPKRPENNYGRGSI